MPHHLRTAGVDIFWAEKSRTAHIYMVARKYGSFRARRKLFNQRKHVTTDPETRLLSCRGGILWELSRWFFHPSRPSVATAGLVRGRLRAPLDSLALQRRLKDRRRALPRSLDQMQSQRQRTGVSAAHETLPQDLPQTSHSPSNGSPSGGGLGHQAWLQGSAGRRCGCYGRLRLRGLGLL